MKKLIILLLFAFGAKAQNQDSLFIRKVYNEALSNGQAYQNLRFLCKNIGPRLSGSVGAQKAVEYTQKLMKDYGFENVVLQDVMVPHWVRGAKEEAYFVLNGKKTKVAIAALGGSVATPKAGLLAEVIEIKDFKELKEAGEAKIKGKIVFFNRPMDPTKLNTFEAYGGAVDQRGGGASQAAQYGAVGVIVRSMNLRDDDFPHTGSMRYAGGGMIPAAAISTNSANLLSNTLKVKPNLQFYFKQNCETLADAPSFNVLSEIKGTEKPEEIIVIGGHLDSWDLAEGAHDDGTGCMQSIEVLRIMNALGYKPKRTIRAVMFMNEENGLRGGTVYADVAEKKKEKHVYAIESDSGGFTPRGFGIVGTQSQIQDIAQFKNLLSPYGLHEIGKGSGGADIGPLAKTGTVVIGFKPDSQRYFDYHHASNDTLETVNKRELELGAASMAALVYLLDNLK
ncbi:MAG TPA: M28 family peptidase [Leadbetterella sp.]|nr:M28 family peptidase [Leadbetterella sp.]